MPLACRRCLVAVGLVVGELSDMLVRRTAIGIIDGPAASTMLRVMEGER